MKKRFALFTAFLAIALVLTACGSSSGGALGLKDTPKTGEVSVGPRVNSLAPNFVLENADGKTVELASLRGKPVLLNFWATWCGPCKGEMPELQRLQDQAGDRIQIFAVNYGESMKEISPFFRSLNLSLPVLLDKDKKVTESGYRLIGLPSTMVIDADGFIRDLRIGPYENDADLAKSVAKVGI